jgi:hypothetical protein
MTTTTTTTINPECCTKIISSIETYLKYAEAVGLTPPGNVP